jgi:hypothetical protein
MRTGIGLVATVIVYRQTEKKASQGLTSYINAIRYAQMKRGPTTPIPVRLDDLTLARIRRAAKRMGSNTSAVVRFSVMNQLPQIEGGRIFLSPESKEAA